MDAIVNLGVLPLATAVEEGAKRTLFQEELPFNQLMTLAAVAYLGTLAASRLSMHLRLPAVLGVLLLGLLMPGPNILSVDQVESLDTVGSAMLLFYAGLNAELHKQRDSLRYGLLLAFGGVALSSLLLGGLIWAIYTVLGLAGLDLVPLPPALALMGGACLSSTDAVPTEQLLSRAQMELSAPMERLLRLESSLNVPLSTLLVLLVAGLASTGSSLHGNGTENETLSAALQTFLKGIGSGVMVGLILTYVGQFILRRFISEPNQVLILGVSLALSSYGLAELLHGSGYISAYVTGLFLANDIYANEWFTPQLLENSLNPFNTLIEFSVFLLFGTLISPATVLHALLPGLLVAFGLILLARPLSVLSLQRFSPFGKREGYFLAWCGLRGAVPLVLALTAVDTVPLLPGLSQATSDVIKTQFEGMVTVVVVAVLTVQGLSLPAVSRRLGLAHDQ